MAETTFRRISSSVHYAFFPLQHHHPKPYQDFIDFKRREHEHMMAERNRIIPGL